MNYVVSSGGCESCRAESACPGTRQGEVGKDFTGELARLGTHRARIIATPETAGLTITDFLTSPLPSSGVGEKPDQSAEGGLKMRRLPQT